MSRHTASTEGGTAGSREEQRCGPPRRTRPGLERSCTGRPRRPGSRLVFVMRAEAKSGINVALGLLRLQVVLNRVPAQRQQAGRGGPGLGVQSLPWGAPGGVGTPANNNRTPPCRKHQYYREAEAGWRADIGIPSAKGLSHGRRDGVNCSLFASSGHPVCEVDLPCVLAVLELTHTVASLLTCDCERWGRRRPPRRPR